MPVYNWKKAYLDTFFAQTPKLLNDNFTATENYIGVFYDPSRGVIISPVNTTGQVKAATVQGVTGIFDTLIVKRQFTNLYQNTTTIDSDYYNAYIGTDVSTRDPSTVGSLENPAFRYVDLQTPYVKIDNDVSYGFKTTQLGQEFQILFDQSLSGGTSPFTILYDPSINGSYKTLTVVSQDSSAAWIKLIAVEYDASWGTTWTVKQHGGSYTIN
jgi:hypothetical protein